MSTFAARLLRTTPLLFCCFAAAPLYYTHAYAAPLSMEATQNEAFEDKPIAKLEIVPENLPPHISFDAKTMVSRLKSKIGDPFSQMTFDSDLKTLAEEYDRVEPIIEVQNGEVYITLRVWPRPLIRSIEWVGNTHIKTKTLKKELGIQSFSTFNRQVFNQAFNKLKEYYVKKGYFEAELLYTTTSDPKTNEVDIRIEIREGRAGKIEDILFVGLTKGEEAEILEMIHTKRYNLFLSWILGTGIYNQDALDQDTLVIVNFLQNKGYADAKVRIEVLQGKSPERIALKVSAEKGQIYHFGTITFRGNHLFSNSEIELHFLARPEGVYSPDRLQNTSAAIKDLYGRKGYIDATVQYETALEPNAPIYNISFKIDEGQQYRIGLIHVIGNVQTQSRIILHESLLVPGETFDSAKLKATQQRLEAIGYFKSVNVYAVKTQDDETLGDDFRDVYIEVAETSTGNANLFFGFSSADDLFGGLDLQESNFNYRGLGKIFKQGPSALRGGGEYAHARASLGSRQRTYSFSWMTPHWQDTPWRVGFDVNKTYSNLQSKDYQIKSVGGALYASYPINPFWSYGLRYRIKHANVHVAHEASLEEQRERRNSGVISALSTSLSYDSTDRIKKPHHGLRSGFELEYAGIGGNFFFAKASYSNTYYSELWPHGIMKYRLDFKFIEPLFKTNHPQDVPLSERLFLGGETSVRGYRPFNIGPHFSNSDPKGGISSSLFSVEYLHELYKVIDGFVFIDAGSVSLQRLRLTTYNMSYGFGARLEVLQGTPITVGMGFPVNASSRSEVQKFFFSMGGQF